MDNSYNYQGLDPKYLEIAKKELKEVPERVQAHIISLRRWLHQCPHISGCPDDNAFLLQFLRAAKFNQEKAQSRLENFCTVRGSPTLGVPGAFVYPDLDHENVEKTLRLGMQLPLGYNENGEYLVLVRLGAWDPDVIEYDKTAPIVHMGADTMMGDERMQIAGVRVIFDMGGMTKKTLQVMFQSKTTKDNARIWQDGYPMRQKGFYYYREPLIFDVIFKMIKFWMNPKLVKRVHRVQDDLKKLHEKCPGSKKLLPQEYGGEAGTIAECSERWIKRFRQYWADGSGYGNIKIDESKRPSDSIKYLKKYEDFPEDIFGTKGTYTPIDAM